MRVIEIIPLDYCLNGIRKYEVKFDLSWDRELILHLKTKAVVDYYPDFPRPFYRASFPNGYILKGIEGEMTCTAFFAEEQEIAFTQFIETVCVLNQGAA